MGGRGDLFGPARKLPFHNIVSPLQTSIDYNVADGWFPDTEHAPIDRVGGKVGYRSVMVRDWSAGRGCEGAFGTRY